MGLNNSSWRNRTTALILRGALALGIATTAIGAAASPALALEASDIGSAKVYTAYNFSSEDDAVRLQTASEVLPAQYDLRDSGVVTPVKFQNPWGTCWGFSAIAASETSILSEKGQTYAETGLGLSERQLAYFAARHLPFGEEGDSYNNQAGEGVYNALTETDCLEDPEIAEDLLGYPIENAIFNQGGLPSYATSVFSDGIGPLPESMVLYQNDEGYLGKDGTYWSPDGTWSLSEELRAKSTVALEESFVLPTPATFDEDGSYVYNELATAAMKEQIYQGRALSSAFCADQSMPGQLSENAYMNPDTWSHYTYEPASANHAVTIVGWDDSYPKENFNSERQPLADGAWIVKNSWGAASNEFPNQRDWGDEGYFYMSNYDQSLVIVEAFDYDINGRETDKNGEFIANQYDYMTIDYSNCDAYDELASAANVFVAEDAQELTSLSCETSQPGTTVTYEVYRLADDAASPTDGELVTSIEETYEYGGYHLVSIPEADRAKAQFAKGERFSVVVTQQGVSGEYLVLAQGGTNEAYHEWAIGVLTESENENHNVEAAIIGELRTRYRNENLDATDEEVDAYIASQADTIAKMVETYIQVALPLFGRSVVNPGESFLRADGAWTDWSDVIASGTLPDAELIDYDNFSIKAYGDPFDLPFPDVAWGEWYFDAVTRAEMAAMMVNAVDAADAGVISFG